MSLYVRTKILTGYIVVIAKNFMNQDLSLVMPDLKNTHFFCFTIFIKWEFEFCSFGLVMGFLFAYLLTFCFK